MISTLRILSRGNLGVLQQAAAPLSTSGSFVQYRNKTFFANTLVIIMEVEVSYLTFLGAQNKSAPPPPTEPATSEAPTEEVRKTQPVKLSFDYKDALNLVRLWGLFGI